MKKFACGLYYFVLVVSMLGQLLSGFAGMTADRMIGIVFTYLTMMAGGIYFFVMELNDSAAPVKSFKLQGKLNTASVMFLLLFFLFFLVSWQGNLENFSTGQKPLTGVPMLDAFLLSLPYGILFIPFVVVFSLSGTYNAVNKEFGITAENADHIVAHGGSFSGLEGAEDVARNKDHLFFCNHKCFVPLDRIVEIEPRDTRLFGRVVETNVVITTDKGNKLVLETRDYSVLEQQLTDYEFLFEHE